MAIGDDFSDVDDLSVAKLNQVCNVNGTGAYLATLSTPAAAGRIVTCHTTGSGFTAGHIYMWDGSSWTDISGLAHTHLDSDTGGAIIGIARANTKYFDTGMRYIAYPQKVDWIQTVDAGAAITDDTTSSVYSIKLDSGSTSGSGATIRIPSLKLDFANESVFECSVKLGATTSLATKIGPSMETVTAADTNTAKYGIESCTTTGANWLCHTASGSARSNTDSGVAMSTSQIGMKAYHYPSTPKVEFYFNNGSAVTKSSDVPTTGTSDTDNLFKFSIKNSTAASKTMFMYGARLAGYINDQWF